MGRTQKLKGLAAASLRVKNIKRQSLLMPNLVAEAAHLVLVGDVTRMKMMNIGSGAALLNRPQ